ncbi:hypothetical protein KXX11_003968, partial [Aspergillus fumigatus]
CRRQRGPGAQHGPAAAGAAGRTRGVQPAVRQPRPEPGAGPPAGHPGQHHAGRGCAVGPDRADRPVARPDPGRLGRGPSLDPGHGPVGRRTGCLVGPDPASL